jgi:hypothetical protein
MLRSGEEHLEEFVYRRYGLTDEALKITVDFGLSLEGEGPRTREPYFVAECSPALHPRVDQLLAG